MNGIGPIFRKEWREVMRDRRVVIGAFVMPLVLVLFMVVLFGGLNQSVKKAQVQVKIGLVNEGEPNLIATALATAKELRATNYATTALAQAALKKGDIAAVLTFPAGFSQQLVTGGAQVRATFDSRNPRSSIGLGVAREVVSQLNLASVRARFITLNLSGELAEPVRLRPYDVAEKTGAAAMGLVGMLPYLIVMWAFYGGVGTAADLVAGEKERGTLETLLTAPVSRQSVAMGKYLALVGVCALSCLASVGGIILAALLRMPGSTDLAAIVGHSNLVTWLSIAALIFSLVLWFAAALLAVSSWARTMREAQTYLTVAGFIVIMPAVFSQVISFTELGANPAIVWVPVLNTAMGLREALLGQLTLGAVVIPSLQNLGLAVLGYAFVLRLFQQEAILRRN